LQFATFISSSAKKYSYIPPPQYTTPLLLPILKTNPSNPDIRNTLSITVLSPTNALFIKPGNV
jgi:hypothetical protein